ncbi:MAG TPA: hypothetical protein PK867_15385 [Pirellulales bacterium]|nr:hypothetical protein [Pirellulales bacterium]
MSFDIFFQPFRYGKQTVEVENPFTGEVQSTHANEPLTPAELKAVEAVIRGADARTPGQSDHYAIELEDGGSAAIFSGGLERGCMVAIHGLTPNLTEFLFGLLKAGNWAMLPAMEDTVLITTSPGSMKGIPDGFPELVVCESVEELDVLLSRGVHAWQKLRDRLFGSQ